MLKEIITFSIRQRFFVIIAALALVVLGGYNFKILPIDYELLHFAAESLLQPITL